MTHKLPTAIAAAVMGLQLLATAASAAPLRCSAEEKACITTCNGNSNAALAPTCIANCRARMSVCKQTGCWSNGVNRYCGLTRQ